MHFPAAVTPVVTQEPEIWFVTLLATPVVTWGLVGLIILCLLIGAVYKGLTKKDIPESDPIPSVTPTPSVAVPIPNREEILAAVSAAIAEELGTDISAIRIHSFRSLEAPVATAPIPERGELVAAISAAIAEELGTDVSAIRIRSFRSLEAPAAAAPIPERGELVAAITAAVAEELGTSVSAIRVHSLRKLS